MTTSRSRIAVPGALAILAAASCAASFVSFAGPVAPGALDGARIIAGADARPASALSASSRAVIFEEDFEDFPLGPLPDIDEDWWGNNQAEIAVSGAEVGAPPEPTFGDRSLLVHASGAGFPGTARSPVFTADFPSIFGVIEVDVLILADRSENDELVTWIAPYNNVAMLSNTRVYFSTGGVIEVLQKTADGAGTAMPTTGSWTFDIPTRIAIEIRPDNVLTVHQDGEHIFTGHDLVQESTGTGLGGFTQIAFATYGQADSPRPYFDNILVLETQACPWDLDGDGLVGASDLGVLLGCWGPVDPGDPCAGADFSGDGSVGSVELGNLLGNWGPCP